MKETSKTYQRLGRIVGIEADLKSKRGVIPKLWDGHTGERIVNTLWKKWYSL